MNVAAEIESINAQLPQLRALWNELAAKGKHAEAASVENEITALERAVARYEIQHQAGRAENSRARAVEAAQPTLAQIEKHKAARVTLERAVSDIEAAAKAMEAAMNRLGPAFTACVATYPRKETYKDPTQQEAYDEALGAAGRNPNFDPIRLRLRLPLVLDILRERGNRGLNDILSRADLARF
jgi:DNA repair exonuclease SbcCD ATPase subunit